MGEEALTNQSSTLVQPRPALQPLRQPGRLPLEILVEIFLLALSLLHYDRQARQKKILVLVCRFWHLVVNSTPSLWSQISVKDSSSYILKSLSKSGKHPIDVRGIRLTKGDGLDATPADVSCKFLQQVQPHAGRWRHVTLRVLSSQLFIPPITILSSLRTLKLFAWDEALLDDQYLALLNQTRAPILSEVSIRSPRIVQWDLISLPPTLSKLEISNVYPDYSLIDRWLSVAAICPNLAFFRLYDTATKPPRPNRVDGNTVPAIVELNALHKLEISNVHRDIVVDILPRLRLPEDCAIALGCAMGNPAPSTSFLTPALSSQSNFQRAGKAIQVTLEVTEGFFRLKLLYQRWRIHLAVRGRERTRDALEWFGVRVEGGSSSNAFSSQLEILQAGGLATPNDLTPVTLRLRQNLLSRKFATLGEIHDLRCITRMEMDSLSGEERRALLLYLSATEDPNHPTRTIADCLLKKPQANQAAAGDWPFPGLCELVRKEVEDNVVYHVLLEPILSRSDGDAEAGMRGGVARSELPEPTTLWKRCYSTL